MATSLLRRQIAFSSTATLLLFVQNGETRVGVCLLYTVPQMDAGPIIAQEALDIDDGIQAHELLCHLFSLGTRSVLGKSSVKPL